MRIELTAKTDAPDFIIEDGKVLIRKMYEIVIINGEAVVRDLPLPGAEVEYLDEAGRKKWFEENKKALMQEIDASRRKSAMELLEKAGIKHVQKTGAIFMPLSAEQAKAMKGKLSK